MRTASILSALMCAAALLAGCHDEDDSVPAAAAGGAGGHGGAGGGGTGGAAGSGETTSTEMTGLTGTAIDTYRTLAGEVKVPVPAGRWSLIEAIVTRDNDVAAYPGSILDDGSLQIPDVPEVPGYLLVFVDPPPQDLPFAPGFKAYISSTARVLDLGSVYSFRNDLTAVTQPTGVQIHAPLTRPWQALTVDGQGNVTQPLDDALQIVSFGADVNATLRAEQGPSQSGAPADGASLIDGWSIDAAVHFKGSADRRPHLISAAAKDDLIVLHDVASRVVAGPPPAAPDPWQDYTYHASLEALRPAPVTMTDGAAADLKGSFEALPPRTFSLDYRGSSFIKALEDAPSKALEAASVLFDLHRVPTSPDPADGAAAHLLRFKVDAASTWLDPTCNPDSCDPTACAAGCNDARVLVLPGDHAHDFEFGDPFDFGQELAAVTLTFEDEVSALLPGDKTPEALRGGMTFRTAAHLMSSEPVIPALGLPRKVKVNDKAAPVDIITTGVGTTPLISFDPPETGKLDYYSLELIALDDVVDAGGNVVRTSVPVCAFKIRDNALRIPDGHLQPGKHYYVQIAAVKTGVDLSFPFRRLVRYARSQTYTGIITP